MSGHALPATIIMVLVLGLPLLAMAFKEPLTAWMEKKKAELDGGVAMYLVLTFFEMFEVLLSFFSNTLSFVRIGAFAVSHAAMMEVVLMLAGFENGATGNWLVIVLGNAFVCAMEGLIVGIQVLRLESYFRMCMSEAARYCRRMRRFSSAAMRTWATTGRVSLSATGSFLLTQAEKSCGFSSRIRRPVWNGSRSC